MNRAIGLMLSFFSVLAGVCMLSAEGTESCLIMNAEEYGLSADGTTDDGPVIGRMLEAATKAGCDVLIRFPRKSTVSVSSGTERYVFRLDRIRNLTIDGNGSTFLVHKDLRFLHATVCSNLTVQNLQVDVVPSPVAEATVLSVTGRRTLKVRLDRPEQADALGGPTLEDGEQDFFGMLWLTGKVAMESDHVYVEKVSVDPGQERGIVLIHSPESLPRAVERRIVPGKTRISLPVPGIAHRYGAGSMIRIDRCTDVEMLDVEVWAVRLSDFP
jgi:hypothetical protein